MQEIDKTLTPKMEGKPIGGWIWVIMVGMIGSYLQLFISILTTIDKSLACWNNFFQKDKNLVSLKY
jgi:hypothetical protein